MDKTLNNFITDLEQKYGMVIVKSSIYTILESGVNDLDFNLEEAIKYNTKKHEDAQNQNKILITTLSFDIAWCNCMSEIINYLKSNEPSSSLIKLILKTFKLNAMI